MKHIAMIGDNTKALAELRDSVMELKDLDERWEEASLNDYRFKVAHIVARCEMLLVEMGVLTADFMKKRRGELGED